MASKQIQLLAFLSRVDPACSKAHARRSRGEEDEEEGGGLVHLFIIFHLTSPLVFRRVYIRAHSMMSMASFEYSIRLALRTTTPLLMS